MKDDTIPMKVSALSVDPISGLPAVLLVEERIGDRTDDRRRSTLSVAVGLGEAPAIVAELDSIELERPATHQLMAALLARAGVKITAVEIHDLVATTFHARIHLMLPSGEHVTQEGRPSDALALALHVRAEIRVAKRLLDKAARLESPEPEWTPQTAVALSCAGLMSMDLAEFSDEAFGKWKM